MGVGSNGPPVWLSASLSVFCAFSSALFSGLTLSLMSLDLFQLRMLTYVTSDDPKELENAECARRILPLKKDSYLLLSTLIVGNVMSNVAISILIGGLLDQFIGFLVSTVVTTILGEIIPQALFSKYSLYLGSLFAPLVRIVEIILYPIVKPISLALNCLLGNIDGTVYNKNELKALFDIHRLEAKILTDEECIMLKGCLDIADIKAEHLMTPLKKIFGLSVSTKLTYNVIRTVSKSGFSKIPIVDYSQESCIVGMIYVRDLIKVEEVGNITCGEALVKVGKPIYTIDEDAGLLSVLTHFRYSTADFAIVRRVVEVGNRDPYYKHIGILTLKNMINKIIQTNLSYSQYIMDEISVDPDNIRFVNFNHELISKICNEFNPYIKYKVENILKNIIADKLSVKLFPANAIVFQSEHVISGLHILIQGSVSMSTPKGNVVKNAPCILYEPLDMTSITSILHNPLPKNIIAITLQELEENLGVEIVSLYDIIALESTVIHILKFEESLQILSLIK